MARCDDIYILRTVNKSALYRWKFQIHYKISFIKIGSWRKKERDPFNKRYKQGWISNTWKFKISIDVNKKLDVCNEFAHIITHLILISQGWLGNAEFCLVSFLESCVTEMLIIPILHRPLYLISTAYSIYVIFAFRLKCKNVYNLHMDDCYQQSCVPIFVQWLIYET